jgi:hypothetical protein
MAKKIYDFLPGHLKNNELETVFETTLDRVFSVGEMEKTKAFVGRREKGIYNNSDIYLAYPTQAYARDNYGLEPTFSNANATDNIFYDDLLNALYNKGALTNDHRRLFKSILETVQLPIDLDKFVNYSMYYWVAPLFDSSIPGSAKKHYVTIDKDATATDFWKTNNSWYHYDDIKSLITDSNFTLISQALRPIIEFDKNIELSDTSAATTIASSFDFPTFKSYDSTNTYLSDIKIFHYVTGAYADDTELGFKPKSISGDYESEFVFNIDLLETSTYKLSSAYKKLYITTTFDYRNLRQELGDSLAVTDIELLQAPKNSNTIDLYVDGQKQIANYTFNSADNKITMNEAVSGNIYVDYCTDTPVVYDGNTVFQRIDPSLEYNVDNKSYYDTEMTYSLVYEHLVRIIETVSGLTGESNAVNNYRTSGTNTDKLRFANQGSVLIKNTIDIKEAYFALTRDDYNPIKATEFLSGAYNGYKNKLLTTIISILELSSSTTKTDLQILEEAIDTISLGKHSSVSIFRDSSMLNFGEIHSHYEEIDVTADSDNTPNRPLPGFVPADADKKDLVIIRNGVIQRLNVDYELSVTEISNITPVLSAGDTLTVRYYSNIKETYIPPSATSLKIAPAYIPDIIEDTGYDTPVKFIQGHDGSLIPSYPLVDLGNGPETNPIDRILLVFETLIYNNLIENSKTEIDSMNYGLYSTAGVNYSNIEKKYIMYPFFKKWMMRNNVDNLDNTDFDADPSAYKTWNYRAKDENSNGYWRGQLINAYGTDRPLLEPWKAIKLSQKPTNFDTAYGSSDYTKQVFWTSFITTESLTCPNPLDSSNNFKTPNELFFGNAITSSDVLLMDQAWEFGDGSPVELAWTRSSEFAFAEFMLMLLVSPFEVMYNYSAPIKKIIEYSNKNEGIDTSVVLANKVNYSFKLGSKLGGFVNNFKLQSENNSLSNSRFSEIPTDNYDLFVHAGVPNRSEYFSAIVLEKVSLDVPYPVYSLANASTYVKGDIVLNSNDGKYYKRKIDGTTTNEDNTTINFDYSAWTLISQPKTSKFGFQVHGYDEINPTFYSMGWDKASGKKVFSTAGDRLALKQWQGGEYYRLDSYVLWNDTPYVCLTSHTSTTLFDDNIKDWKPVTEWPTTNKTHANGYKELVDDTIKNYNYGDILDTVDDVAHLILGYQHYLKLVGWDFTEVDQSGDVVDWENLLLKFLDWQSEQHDIGDFITLTPLLTGGSFNATYGVASVASETFKNFYRVVDSSGRLIPSTELNFHTDGSKLTFTSNVPIYGMKMDVRDIEHAFVVDRIDSYEDVIYDPHTHTRNLRMQIDCNRTIDWDGTMSVDGYLVNNNQLIPNFDTMVEETRHYRNTIVDQGLSIVNKLKSNHMGYTTRAYLSNHGIERESQLEFYKGFLSHKGTNSSINRIVNNNSNFKDIKHSDIWAVKLSDYGQVSTNLTMTKDITVNDMISDPFLIDYPNITKTLVAQTSKPTLAIKTAGYVDASDVNYTVNTESDLVDLANPPTTLYEGDITWVRFDTERDWDVVRLSEVAEISYVGETADNQLYIGMLTEIDSAFVDKPIYLKISGDEIDPSIDGYYLLAANGTKTVSGSTIYEYLVFEEDFEPVIIEIDSSTTSSIFVPTNTDSGIEAIGSVSNPVFTSSDTLVVDNESFTYSSTAASSSGISIKGTVANPVVSEGEQARFVIYNSDGLVANGTNTTVTFSGTVATTTGAFSSTYGDKITIDGTELTIDYSNTESISKKTTATRVSPLTTNNNVVIDGNTKTVVDLSVTGTAYAGPTSSAEYLKINDTQVEFPTASTLTNIVDIINSAPIPVTASESSNILTITTSEPFLILEGSFLNDLGLSTLGLVKEYKLDNLATELDTISDITAIIDVDGHMVIGSSDTQMIISGTALTELGITAGTYDANDDPTATSVVSQINALPISDVSAAVVTGLIKITSTDHNLDIVEVTTGAMSRLGFATTTIAIDATDTIVSDLNAQVFTGATTTAVKSDRQVLITSSESSIVSSNITGNSLSDIGIAVGTFSNTTVLSSTALGFAGQMTAASTKGLSVNLSSDGRMIFTSDGVSMSFSGTPDAILTKVGLVRDYSAHTSSANYKAMLWKSVRHTPGVNGTTWDDFYTSLGLLGASKLWRDDYENKGWAILDRDTAGNLTVYARQSTVIDTDLTKRLIIQDDEKFINHQIYDPLNLKMPGSIVSKLEYIAWNDPASYDTTTSNDIWLDEKLNKIWWDTDLARFYRYNDYGDSDGNLNINYVKKYWGTLVPGSTVVVKKWIKSRILPVETTIYNTKKYYDDVAGKEVTDYFYWSSASDDVVEIAMLISAGGTKNKFIPVGASSVLISNNATSYDSETINTTLHYQQESGVRNGHSDWELLSEASNYVVPKKFLNDMTESVSGVTILQTLPVDKMRLTETQVDEDNLIDADWVIIDTGIAGLLGDKSNIVVTTNSKITGEGSITVNASHFQIDNTSIKIHKSSHTVMAGDIIRDYQVVSKADNWFENNANARDNFASVINDTMSNKILTTLYSNYTQYLDTDDIIFELNDWYLNDNYKTIDVFSYLSTTRNFDMIAEYEKGIKSFKLKLPTHNEYYFEHDNTLKLVNRSKSSLSISFDNMVYPETSFSTYYDNAVGIQIHELMNLIEDYPDVSFINDIFFTMINYLYTEKSYPAWLFKTSYIDLNLYNRDLKQYAVYQRDSEEDVLEYVREAKPYHTKIREIKRTNATSDKLTASTTIDEEMIETIAFGKVDTDGKYISRYAESLRDGGEYDTSSHPTLYISAGSFVIGKEYWIKTVGTTDFTLIGAADNDLHTKFTATGVGVGTGTATTHAFNDQEDGEYEQGSLIPYISNPTFTSGSFKIGTEYQILTTGTTDFTLIGAADSNIDTVFTATGVGAGTGTANDTTVRFPTTSGPDGFDTGFVRFDGLEANILKLETYTGDIVTPVGAPIIGHTETIKDTLLYAYDIYGRGYSINVTDTGTISAFDGTTLTITPAHSSKFDDGVSDTNKKLIAVQKAGSSDMEFMLYDKKVGSALTISNRALYTGLGHAFTNLDTVYVLDTPLQLVLQDLL